MNESIDDRRDPIWPRYGIGATTTALATAVIVVAGSLLDPLTEVARMAVAGGILLAFLVLITASLTRGGTALALAGYVLLSAAIAVSWFAPQAMRTGPGGTMEVSTEGGGYYCGQIREVRDGLVLIALPNKVDVWLSVNSVRAMKKTDKCKTA